MNYFTLLSSYPDHTVASAWDSSSEPRNKSVSLASFSIELSDDLFQRYTECYADLRALPRAARRALQRQLARSSKIAAVVAADFSVSPSLRVSQSFARVTERRQYGSRRLQHRMAWSLTGAALLLALAQGTAMAATITVTTSNPNVAADGQCSLIEAIINANNDAATHPDCSSGSGTDVIVLPSNATITLSNGHETVYSNPIGLPIITTRITIEGNGAVIRRPVNGGPLGLLAVNYPGELTLDRVTLTGGLSRIGGAVVNSGTLTIKNSTISGNTATLAGGGVYGYYGDIIIENSTISGNIADRDGAGIHSRFGTLTIINSTISGNRASRGAGVYKLSIPGWNDALTIANSLIAGNQATTAPEIENLGGPVNVNKFNLIGINGNAGSTGFFLGPTDIVPALGVHIGNIVGPLKNNGGLNRTHGLVVGSPAIDAGDPTGCRSSTGAPLLTDQRGLNRTADGNHDGTARCDIGAVEGVGVGPIDVDGDGKTDIGIYRSGAWSFLRSSDAGNTVVGWGGGGQDVAIPGDYDGDGKIDIAIYRAGAWSILRSSDGANTVLGWGGAAQDVLIPADYDGDGKADIGVYRDGVWSILRSSDGGNTIVAWGGSQQDIPVPADYDGDGKTDIAIYRVDLGLWSILRSSDGGNTIDQFIGSGFPQDIPVPVDYDGDGKADIALYRDGTWVIRLSSTGGIITVSVGQPQDEPVPADYDGDGRADVATYKNGVWTIKRSSDRATVVVGWGGAAEDIPVN